ncbi:hypothetical protein FOXB_04601 [Fusarium oxysporum f. sp. conglutinans Fo5176]|uniref:Uncharacterized protein n=2 Tax=Fusarium oxysporum f. sp. conglutinans TaxID=100902 RepID=F9FDX3_FUSOF|nr:hypothetical protein FOXB_04601 [Fusarium oxysporum f. sp. conglutinans Fo5176]
MLDLDAEHRFLNQNENDQRFQRHDSQGGHFTWELLEMAHHSSGQNWHFMYPHNASEHSVSSLLPPLYWDSFASATAPSSQDLVRTAPWPIQDNSTIPLDDSIVAYPYHSSLSDPTLYYWPFWSPWESNYWFADSQEYSNCYSLPPQAVLETTPFAFVHDALHQQSTLPYIPNGKGFDAGVVDLGFLAPDERYIVESRLENIKWKFIQVGYAMYWKPMTISGLAMKLSRMREKHKVLEHIIPVRPHGGLKAS